MTHVCFPVRKVFLSWGHAYCIASRCLPELTRHSLSPRCRLRLPTTVHFSRSEPCCLCGSPHGAGAVWGTHCCLWFHLMGAMQGDDPVSTQRAWRRPAGTLVMTLHFRGRQASAGGSIPWTLLCGMSWRHCTTSRLAQAAPSTSALSCRHAVHMKPAVSLGSKPQGNRGVCTVVCLWAPAPVVRVPASPISAPAAAPLPASVRVRAPVPPSLPLPRPLQSLPRAAIV